MKKHILFLVIILITISCRLDERPESISYSSMYLMTENETEKMLYGSWKLKGCVLTSHKYYMDPVLGKRERQISDDKDYPVYTEYSFEIEEDFFKPGLHLYRIHADEGISLPTTLEFLDVDTYETRLLKYDSSKPMQEWEIHKDALIMKRQK
ncbi:MAG: hypothetical protein ACRCV0_02440 [Brevinema sp.]